MSRVLIGYGPAVKPGTGLGTTALCLSLVACNAKPEPRSESGSDPVEASAPAKAEQDAPPAPDPQPEPETPEPEPAKPKAAEPEPAEPEAAEAAEAAEPESDGYTGDPRCAELDADDFCHHDPQGEFEFEALEFATSLDLALEVPPRPEGARWLVVKDKLPAKEIRSALSIRRGTAAITLDHAPTFMDLQPDDGPLGAPYESAVPKPFFWWPEDDAPILVIPLLRDSDSHTFKILVFARKTAAGWTAAKVSGATGDHYVSDIGSEQSAYAMRADGLELFLLTQTFLGSTFQDEPSDRNLCRLRWEQGALAKACTDEWRMPPSP